MKTVDFTATVGFSVRDVLALYWLSETKDHAAYPKQLHTRFTESFPGRQVGYDYVARIAKVMEAEGVLTVSTVEGKRYYRATDKGLRRLEGYTKLYREKFAEVKIVLDRFYYELTHNGEQPPPAEEPLPDEFRAYFSRLVSVKDLVRLTALKLGRSRSNFYMAQVGEQLPLLYGWAPSNGYLYQIAREMEETGLLEGYWPDERRTVRYLRLTDEGNEFYDVVANSTTERLQQLRTFLGYMLRFLKEK